MSSRITNSIEIDKNTAFILGAGASTDFDFPTGFGLKSEIISKVIPSQKFQKLARE